MSFFDDDGVLREREHSPSRRRIWLLLATFVLLALAGYVALHRYSDDRVPLGVSVEGVSIGGLTTDAAVTRLAQRLGPDLTRPIEFTSSDHTYPFNAAEAGVRIDFRGSVAATGVHGERWSPQSLWGFLTHGGDRDAVVHIDRSTFDAALVKLTGTIGRPAVEGSVSFRNGKARPVFGRSGLSIDADQTAQMVPRLLFEHTASELPMAVRQPYVSRAQVLRALHDFGEPAMSGPVRLLIADHPFVLSPKLFGAAIQMVPSAGGLVPLVDGEHLAKVLAPALTTVGPVPVDATLRLHNGRPVVVPAVDGAAYDEGALSRAFVAALTRKGPARVARVHAAITRPGVSTATARRWQVRHRVASLTVRVDGTLASKLDGAVVTPGHELHLSKVLGRTDARIGSAFFTLALRSSMDIDSFSPTLAHHPGLPLGRAADDVEVSAPAGRAWLISVEKVGTKLARFVVWSGPGTRAKITVGRPTTPAEPTTATSSSPECTPRAGRAGFTVAVTRTGPGIPSRFESTYLPVNAVECVPATPTPAP